MQQLFLSSLSLSSMQEPALKRKDEPLYNLQVLPPLTSGNMGVATVYPSSPNCRKSTGMDSSLRLHIQRNLRPSLSFNNLRTLSSNERSPTAGAIGENGIYTGIASDAYNSDHSDEEFTGSQTKGPPLLLN